MYLVVDQCVLEVIVGEPPREATHTLNMSERLDKKLLSKTDACNMIFWGRGHKQRILNKIVPSKTF